MQKICVIIPCYNEEKRLPTNDYISYFKNNKNRAVCFVNDGSNDNTLNLLIDIKEKIGDNCSIVNITKNRGKAEAVRLGFVKNLEEDFDYLGFFDADLATPLSEVDHFINFNGNKLNHDVYIGSRFKRLGARIERNSLRHYVGRVFSTFASIALRLPVYDTQCGAKIFSKRYAKLIFNKPFISKWLFDIELLSRIISEFGRDKVSESVIEVPLNTWIEKGDSKISKSYFIKAPLDLIQIYLYYRKALRKI